MTAALVDRIIVGKKAIARRFGCSPRTLDREIIGKVLITFRTGPKPSPIRARASAIEAALRKLEGRE